MGSEDLFHKRKAKKERDLSRRKPIRSIRERVLIVCEGEKTEPNYFEELKDYYRLSTADVVVDGSSNSAPMSVYEHATERVKLAKKEKNAYDKIFCVFDKDIHSTYSNALDAIKRNASSGYRAIVSVPCFEYWLLLHYEYTTSPFVSNGSSSAGDQITKRLRKHLPTYAKGSRGLFKTLVKRMEVAKTRAKQALDRCASADTDNPSTRVHELVDYLEKLSKV